MCLAMLLEGQRDLLFVMNQTLHLSRKIIVGQRFQAVENLQSKLKLSKSLEGLLDAHGHMTCAE